MPKRTNLFQAVVAHIAAELAPLGAQVHNSIEIQEIGLSGVRREIDTLIEIGVSLTRVRIAIECRAHGRPADVQWIDSLIGKYARLPIDRVVAVSASGFSGAAKRKANQNRIQLLVPRTVATLDWPKQFTSLTLRCIVPAFSGAVIKVANMAPLSDALVADDDRIFLDGDPKPLKIWCFLNGLSRRFEDEFWQTTGRDLDRFLADRRVGDTWDHSVTYDLRRLASFSRADVVIPIESVYLSYQFALTNGLSAATHQRLGRALLSTTSFGDSSLTTVQIATKERVAVFGQGGEMLSEMSTRACADEPVYAWRMPSLCHHE